jgi:hypothetical protein
MSYFPARLGFALLGFVVLTLIACKGDDKPTATSTAPAAVTAAATPAPTDTPPAATETPAPELIDPCSLRESLEGQPLTDGPSFALDGGAGWQLCIGGAAAGSSEKYLFGTADGGVSWTLLSMTTLGSPTPEPGVGELPNGNAAEALFFTDAEKGWLGLSSPGQNLYHSDDGGVSWSAVAGLSPGLPVTAIDFSDADTGTLTTPDGDWTTADGGATWAPAP